MPSKIITKMDVWDEIIIEGVVRLQRAKGRRNFVLCIESPIEIKIEKRINADAKREYERKRRGESES